MWPASEGWGSFETHRNNPDPRTEGYVAALFQALIDSSNENNDETTYSASSVATAFRSCRVRVNSAWRKLNQVADFVWCMENQIDAGLHQEHFPGLGTPTHHERGARQRLGR